MTLQVPIANLAFSLPFMPKRQFFSWENMVGLVVIMSGLLTYRFWAELRAWFITKMNYKQIKAETLPDDSDDEYGTLN